MNSIESMNKQRNERAKKPANKQTEGQRGKDRRTSEGRRNEHLMEKLTQIVSRETVVVRWWGVL